MIWQGGICAGVKSDGPYMESDIRCIACDDDILMCNTATYIILDYYDI